MVTDVAVFRTRQRPKQLHSKVPCMRDQVPCRSSDQKGPEEWWGMYPLYAMYGCVPETKHHLSSGKKLKGNEILIILLKLVLFIGVCIFTQSL